MPREIFPEFRDQQAATRYPFADLSTLTADSGQVIEPDAFLDASLYPIGAVGPLFLSRVSVTAHEVTLAISDEQREVAFAAYDALSPAADVMVFDAYGRAAGIIILGLLPFVPFAAWPPGDYAFSVEATEFAVSCVIPTPEPGVRGVLSDRNELLAGQAWLVGQDGVVLRELEAGVIRVDVVGDPLFLRKLCEPVELFKTPNFVRSINGCPPDRYGNFNLTVGDHDADETIVRVYPRDGGLVIEAVGKPIRGIGG